MVECLTNSDQKPSMLWRECLKSKEPERIWYSRNVCMCTRSVSDCAVSIPWVDGGVEDICLSLQAEYISNADASKYLHKQESLNETHCLRIVLAVEIGSASKVGIGTWRC